VVSARMAAFTSTPSMRLKPVERARENVHALSHPDTAAEPQWPGGPPAMWRRS